MAKRQQATELVPLTETGTAVGFLEDLHDKAKTYAANAHSDKTRLEYAKVWAKFTGWCARNDMPYQPAIPATLAAYLTWIADGQQGAGKRGSWADGHKLAKSTISLHLAAIKHYHRQMGHSLQADLDHPALKQLMAGIRRTIGQSRSVRRVKPITAVDLRDMLEMLRLDVLREARDAAVLAVGFGACRRRSEVVGLNYLERDPKDKACRGVLSVDDNGISVRLNVSKTNQSGEDEQYIVARKHAPLLCEVTENWLRMANIQKGEPLFRGIKISGTSKRPQSGYPGVYWHRTKRDGTDLWMAAYRKPGNRKLIGLGMFEDVEEAYKAYCKASGAKPIEKSSPFHLQGNRMGGDQVALIIKKRYKELLVKRLNRKKPKDEELEIIAQQVADMSGHSMRVGHITSAAEAGVPSHHIQLASGHKTAAMISVYTRVQDKVGNSSLKGMKL